MAELTVINPFDFFLDSDAEQYPFTYASWLSEELLPYLRTLPVGAKLSELVASISRASRAHG